MDGHYYKFIKKYCEKGEVFQGEQRIAGCSYTLQLKQMVTETKNQSGDRAESFGPVEISGLVHLNDEDAIVSVLKVMRSGIPLTLRLFDGRVLKFIAKPGCRHGLFLVTYCSFDFAP
jgi:hypothetical protein